MTLKCSLQQPHSRVGGHDVAEKHFPENDLQVSEERREQRALSSPSLGHARRSVPTHTDFPGMLTNLQSENFLGKEHC